jgi:competence protein ComEA
MRRLILALVLAFAACESDGGTHAPRGVININQATVADLESLPGIGEKRARAIIASRNARGGLFATYDEILEIDGIGEVTMNRLRAYVTLGPAHPKKR